MNEIIKIILIFPIFLLFLSVPINIFKSSNNQINLNLLIFNLIINLNILLLFSFFPIPIENYQLILLSIYLLIFLYYLFSNKLNLHSLTKKSYLNFLILFFTFIILSINISNQLNLGWDAKYFYYIKSLFFFEGLGLNELSEFEHNKWHPYFGSYLWAFFWSLPNFEYEYFGRLFYLFTFCIAIYFITCSDKKNSIIQSIIYLFLLILLFSYERFSGLQEVLLFSLLLVSSKILYDLNFDKKFLNLLILLLIINLLIWTKSEGIVYSLIIFSITLLNKKISFKEKVNFFLIIIILLGIKYLVYSVYNFETNSQPYDVNQIFNITLESFIYRLEKIIIYSSYYSLKNPLFVIGIFILIYLNFNKINRLDLRNYNIFFTLNIFFIFGAYLLRDMEIIYSLKTTLERIIFTSSSFYIYLICLFINKLIEKKNYGNSN